MANLDEIKNFESLIKKDYTIKIPAYQRAYAWEKEQIQQFVDDLIDTYGKDYYYGHFIFEQNEEEKILEVIDGQQRITTYVLFLLSAKLYFKYELSEDQIDFIKNRFQTIDYDKERFKELVDNVINYKTLIDELEEDTSSFKRILKALKNFKTIFDNKKDISITQLITSLNNAIVSLHFTDDKKVAVQIFELKSKSGVQFGCIEKFKAWKMKEIYLNAEENQAVKDINEIQNHFCKIYKFEEQTKTNHTKEKQ